MQLNFVYHLSPRVRAMLRYSAKLISIQGQIGALFTLEAL